LEPLDLQDGQQVRIRILKEESQDEPPTLKEEQAAYVVAADEDVESALAEVNETVETKGSIDDLIQKLIREGRLRPRPRGPVPPPPLSEAELKALADKLGHVPGKTTSEMVIEDRGEW
jgi:hypothetical protein